MTTGAPYHVQRAGTTLPSPRRCARCHCLEQRDRIGHQLVLELQRRLAERIRQVYRLRAQLAARGVAA